MGRNKKKKQTALGGTLNRYVFPVFLLCAILLYVTSAHAVALNVTGSDGNPVTGYRWTIEEDTTYHVQFDGSGNPIPDPNTLSVSFHSSYMPVVASGDETTPLPTLEAGKNYYVSVIPKASGSYSIGGASFSGDANVNITLNKLPIPTAQITIFVFEDIFPINNAPDLPEEQGQAGFSIILEDAGGRFGMSAGVQMMDAFGNPLGTTYNPDGTVAAMGDGVILTDAEGMATIKNLAPGKYGIQAVPPGATKDPITGEYVSSNWVQTSTIEGTKVIDAWVKANEPPYFQEFGPPGWHVFIGFVKAGKDSPYVDATVLKGGSKISGQVVNLHLSRPPDYAFYDGAPLAHTTAWVGLNEGAAGAGKGIYAARANSDGTFSIPNVPPGQYQLVVWDDALDVIFAFHSVTVGDGNVDLGNVPVFQWFTRLENHVFIDANENGLRDDGENGISDQAVNLRWRDGTMYQSMPTDMEGFVPFDQVFPFFAWLVAEVDFARFKATGVTVTVDDGGPIDSTDPLSWGGQLNPQPQDPTDPANEYHSLYQRSETGMVLTQAFQGFLGQTSVLEWGKANYGPGIDGEYGTLDDENGGISGVVYYSTTRAEDDPRYGAAEPWEPGIPRVTVNLYDSTGTILLNTTTTDSWDDSQPTGCQGEVFNFLGSDKDCYDGLRNFNQIRPGVFDGGYAFTTFYTDGAGNPVAYGTEGAIETALPAGEYVLEVIPPAGYEIVKEEDKNVDFGEEYVPSPLALPPVCVGEPHDVPQYLTLFEDQQIEVANWTEGMTRPLCDRKQVFLSGGQNAAADFFLLTKAPIAGHIYGFILDDTQNEFDPAAPNFGEKYAPPWMPISIRDWTGTEISRTYSDQYGVYNALVPSTYTANLPQPSGMSPNMLTVCLNSPLKADGSPDPLFNPQYSQYCYTFQYMPGATTYLDTPVLPVAAFAGPGQNPVDCEFAAGTPRIKSVTVDTNGVGGGPYIPTGSGNRVNGNQTIVITSEGLVSVPNPAYDGIGGTYPNKTIQRDFGFGTDPGTVSLEGVTLTDVIWSDSTITATVPDNTSVGQVGGKQLVVTRSNGVSTETGVTVQVGLRQGATVRTVSSGGTIQAAIDAANANDLILVGSGTYNELVVMWKPVQLQGWGPGAVTINAVKAPAEKLLAWREKVTGLITSGLISLLPEQNVGPGNPEPTTLFDEEGPGIIVLARSGGNVSFGQNRNQRARIDGITITGSDHAGGIVVNGYADYLDISNNRIISNNGVYGGGIRIGHPTLTNETGGGLEYADSHNDNIRIRYNHITQNSGLNEVGGGVSLYTGTDAYQITENYICGNFSMGGGGGIGHQGLSDGGMIDHNTIIFNESFQQMMTVNGGGILIAGGAPLGVDGLSPGSGSVTVNANLIKGNSASAGDGGGIRVSRANGQDIDKHKNNPDQWYKVDILNNMIVNNVAALAGGGISLQDSVRVNIINNTVAHNDSTATAGEAFPAGSPSASDPQPAGIVSRAHVDLDTVFGDDPNAFSNPVLKNNIIWKNRSFSFMIDYGQDPPTFGLVPDVGADDAPVYWDLSVLGTLDTQMLNPLNSILTHTAGYDASNSMGDPMFALGYFNGDRGETISQPELTTGIQAPPAFDEGGNFIRHRFGPLTPTGDYHITSDSAALNAIPGFTLDIPGLGLDFDDQIRPNGIADIGADELY